MLAAFGQESLNINSPLVIAIDDRDVLKGVKTIHDGPVVGQVARTVTEFEDDGATYGDLTLSDERRERGNHERIREAGESAGVGQERGASHLGVAAPCIFSGCEVEPIGLAKK